MTDPIEALAEGLRSLADPDTGIIDEFPDEVAQALAATPSVAALLAEAEVGRAVLALLTDMATVLLSTQDGTYYVTAEDWNREGLVPFLSHHSGEGPTLPAAIAAALEDGA